MLADGFPLRFEWQQISSNLQDTSQYSVRSQKCYSLDVFHSSFYFQVLQSCTNYLVTVLSALIANYITVIFMFHSFLSSLVKSMYLSLFLLWLSFTLWSAWTTKVTVFQFLYLLFFLLLSLGLVIWPWLRDPFVTQNPKGFSVSYFPNAPITIIITIISIFHSFSVLKQSLSTFKNFSQWSVGMAKSTIPQFLFLFFFFWWGRWLLLNLVEIRRTVYTSKSHGNLCVLFSRTDSEFCEYHLFVGSNLNFLHISLWITVQTQSFCAKLQNLLLIWLIVSSRSPYKLHFLYCFVFEIVGPYGVVLYRFLKRFNFS